MSQFKERALAPAVRERAQSANPALWLTQAKKALFEIATGQGEKSAESAAKLSEMENWPSKAEMDLELDQLAQPIVELMSKALCWVETVGAEGRVATLWLGAVKAIASGGHLRFEGEGAELALSKATPETLFASSSWSAQKPGLTAPAVEPSRTENALSEVTTMELRGRRAAEDKKYEQEFANADDGEISSMIGKGLLGLGRQESQAAKEGLSRTLELSRDARVQSGAERGQELLLALEELGPRVLRKAATLAGEGLALFLKTSAPEGAQAAALFEKIWRFELSVTARAQAQAMGWAPLAQRLLEEDGPRASLALLLAPDLGLKPSAQLLSEAKSAMKKMGLPEGVWKELDKLPREGMASILKDLRLNSDFVMGQTVRLVDLEDEPGRKGAMLGPAQRDPFASTLSPSPNAAEALRRAIEPLSWTAQAAQSAGLSLAEGLGFCSVEGAGGSSLWNEPIMESLNSRGLDFSAAYEELIKPELSAGESFINACRRKLGEAPEGPESVEAVLAENQAIRSKAPKVLALAMREARARLEAPAFAELSDITDWLTRSEMGVWQALPDKPSWASLKRRSDAWHAEVRVREDQEAQEPWEARLFEPILKDGLRATELRNGAELFEEGKAMGHCVSSYAKDCREGACRIYSIQEGGSRLATLEVGFRANQAGEAEGWMAQLRGQFNKQVEDPRVTSLCKEVVEAINERLRVLPKERQRSEAASEGGAELLSSLAARRLARQQEPDRGPALGR